MAPTAAPQFTPAKIAEMRPRIAEHVERRLDAMESAAASGEPPALSRFSGIELGARAIR